MKPLKLKVKKSTKRHLLELREKLSKMALSDEHSSKVIGGCGVMCAVSCSYYCRADCVASCRTDCQGTCTDTCTDNCRGVGTPAAPGMCEVMQIIWWP